MVLTAYKYYAYMYNICSNISTLVLFHVRTEKELDWAVEILNSIISLQHQSRHSYDARLVGGTQTAVDVFEILRQGLEPYLIAYWGMIMTVSEVSHGFIFPLLLLLLSLRCT